MPVYRQFVDSILVNFRKELSASDLRFAGVFAPPSDVGVPVGAVSTVNHVRAVCLSPTLQTTVAGSGDVAAVRRQWQWQWQRQQPAPPVDNSTCDLPTANCLTVAAREWISQPATSPAISDRHAAVPTPSTGQKRLASPSVCQSIRYTAVCNSIINIANQHLLAR